MDTPMYLRREGTDLIFVATDALLKRKDMKLYHGPVPFRKENVMAMPRLDEVKKQAGLDVTRDGVGTVAKSSKGRNL